MEIKRIRLEDIPELYIKIALFFLSQDTVREEEEEIFEDALRKSSKPEYKDIKKIGRDVMINKKYIHGGLDFLATNSKDQKIYAFEVVSDYLPLFWGMYAIQMKEILKQEEVKFDYYYLAIHKSKLLSYENLPNYLHYLLSEAYFEGVNICTFDTIITSKTYDVLEVDTDRKKSNFFKILIRWTEKFLDVTNNSKFTNFNLATTLVAAIISLFSYLILSLFYQDFVPYFIYSLISIIIMSSLISYQRFKKEKENKQKTKELAKEYLDGSIQWDFNSGRWDYVLAQEEESLVEDYESLLDEYNTLVVEYKALVIENRKLRNIIENHNG